MSEDHCADTQRTITRFEQRGWVASARSRNDVFIGVPADYEGGTCVLDPTLFLELHRDRWCLRRYRFGGRVEDGPCADLDRVLDLAARSLVLPPAEFAARFTPRNPHLPPE